LLLKLYRTFSWAAAQALVTNMVTVKTARIAINPMESLLPRINILLSLEYFCIALLVQTGMNLNAGDGSTKERLRCMVRLVYVKFSGPRLIVWLFWKAEPLRLRGWALDGRNCSSERRSYYALIVPLTWVAKQEILLYEAETIPKSGQHVTLAIS
jgi:hypothetical protein